MKKILSSLLLVILLLVFVSGCGDKDNTKDQTGTTNTTPKTTDSSGKINSSSELVNKTGMLTCTREGTASGDITPSFSYVVTYREGELLTLRAVEKVSSPSGTGLEAYYNAYMNINKNYDGLEYYSSEVTKTDTTVVRDTTIDYEHIDTERILRIEGNEDNIIDENGKASLDMWLKLANKFGTKCNESSI